MEFITNGRKHLKYFLRNTTLKKLLLNSFWGSKLLTTGSLLVFLLIFLVFGAQTPLSAQTNIQGTAPVQDPNGGFGIDGDARANFPTDGIGDWFKNGTGSGGFIFPEGYEIPGGGDFEGVINFQNADMTYFFRDDITNNDPSIFIGSNKINDDPETYEWGSGSSPNKNEIQTAAAHFTYGDPGLGGDPNDLWVIFAADRQVTNGSSYIDFEFLQKSLTRTGTTSGSFLSDGTEGGRTVGDILVTIEFTIGGGAANAVIRKWDGNPTDGYQYVLDTDYPSGTIYITNNIFETVVPWSVYNTDPIASGPDAGNYQYEINQWAEGAVNLSQLFDQDECFNISTLFVRTRTSGSSGQSELKDFPEGPVQLTLNLIPDISFEDPDPVCSPATVDLTEIVVEGCDEGTLSYWMDEEATIPVEDETAVGAGTYYIQCASNVNPICVDIAPVNVTVDTTPDITVTNPDAVCSPSTVDITDAASGCGDGSTLSYWLDEEATMSLDNPSAISESGTYYIKCTNDGNANCFDIEPVEVTVSETPDLTVTDPDAACSPDTVDITGAASGCGEGFTLTYWLDEEATMTLDTPSAVSESGTYYIKCTNDSNADCFDIEPVNVTINDTPELDPIGDVTECDEYTLPDPSTISGSNLVDPQYYDDSQANGGTLITELTLTESQTVWVYDETGTTPNCYDEISFDVVITDSPVADELPDVTECDEYILPELSPGNQYFTETGGGGTELFAGDAITSTQDIYIYAGASEPCVADENMFTVTIYDSPEADDIPDVTRCDSYTLPALSEGNQYFTGSGATGTELFAGDNITSTQDIYVYAAATEPCVADENMFTVTINYTPELDPIADVTECDEYTLPDPSTISGSNLVDPQYYNDSQANGGTLITNLTLTASQTVWVYDETGTDPNCYDEISFMVTIEDCAQEGCTLGYWKNHTDRWCDAYTTCTLYGDVFSSAPSELADLTLLEVLNLGGGGIYNLGRQSVAALLNTCSGEVEYAYSNISTLISDVNNAFDTQTAGYFGSYLDELNNAGCPLGGSRATTAPSEECTTTSSSLAAEESGFSVSPVPFKDQLQVKYNFNYTSNVNIQVFNFSGQMVGSYKAKGVKGGDITQLSLDFSVRSGQPYIIRVVTDRDVFSKTILSSD